MFDRRWSLTVFATALFFAVLIQVPQVLHMIDARFEGVIVQLNSDEFVYQARVEEALNGRPGQTAEAVIGDSGLLGSQFALLEAVYGSLFAWTGLRAPVVLQIMDSVVVFGVFLSLLWFFRQSGFSRKVSYAGAVFFILLQLNNLNRPIHPGGSFFVMLLSLNLLLAGMHGRIVLGILGGVLLGCLIGVYPWSWTFAWLWFFLLCSWMLIEAYVSDGRRSVGSLTRCSLLAREIVKGSARENVRQVRRAIVFGVAALLAAVPFVWMLLTVMRHPLYAEAVFRSGMHPSRWPESLPYSILFIGIAFSLLTAVVMRFSFLRSHRAAIIVVCTAFIVIHQQVIHGITFNFVSHYLLSLVFAGTCVLLLFLQSRVRHLLPAVFCAAVYLAAVGWDGRWVLKQFHVVPGRFDDQALASAFPVLDTLPRQTILADPYLSLFLAGSTKHDVLYTVYVKNVLIPHAEIAERYCLTVLPLPPSERHIEDQEWLIYPDAVAAFENDPAVREREVAMVKDACARIDADPVNYLKKYHVDAVFWDEKRQPLWELSRLSVPLEKIGERAGEWSLWKMRKP